MQVMSAAKVSLCLPEIFGFNLAEIDINLN